MISATDVQAILGLGSTRTAEVNLAIARVEADFIVRCDRVFSRETDRQIIVQFNQRDPRSHLFRLPNSPIDAVRVKIWEEGEVKPVFTDEENEVTDFVLNETSGLLNLTRVYGDRFLVQYTGGYAVYPNDIREALTAQASLIFMRDKPEFIASSGTTNSNTGDSISFREDHPLFKRVVNKYRRITL